MTTHVNEAKEFTPKEPPKLKPPKDDFISVEALSACDGKTQSNILRQPNISDLKSFRKIINQSYLRSNQGYCV